MGAALAAWASAHRRLVAELLGAAILFSLGYFLHKPQPSVTEHTSDVTAATSASHTVESTDKAPGTAVAVEFAPQACPPAQPEAREPITTQALCRPVVVPCDGTPIVAPPGERIAKITIEREGGVQSTITTDTAAATHEEKKLDLVISGEPHYSLLFGTQLLPERRIAFGGAVRLPNLPILGTWWAQAEVAPNLKNLTQSDVRGFLRKDF